MRLRLARRQPFAAIGHLGAQESIDHRFGFVEPRGEHHAALNDGDAGFFSHLCPDIPRLPRHGPAIAGLLARDGDETEIAHRSAIGLRIAVDDNDTLAALGRRMRVRQADDTGTGNGEIIDGHARSPACHSGPRPGWLAAKERNSIKGL